MSAFEGKTRLLGKETIPSPDRPACRSLFRPADDPGRLITVPPRSVTASLKNTVFSGNIYFHFVQSSTQLRPERRGGRREGGGGSKVKRGAAKRT